ncbi:hypothetical protein Goe25_00740 [Bacillus phage vB_BsuM-Goe25]|nr:hypothetical protein BSP12_068 [Bacillus phage BSP12]UJJ74879.1 hypothetical protein [Bacillus phage BM-P1]WCS69702.1 hypothetical protein Goe25_00740 [Bacillus phage vB_BsuM-Goe25]
MPRKKSVRPKLFKSNSATKSTMKRLGDTLVQKTLDAGMDAARDALPNDTNVVRKPKYLQVTEKRMNKLGIIDLKPYFKKSPKTKRTKSGGWYLTVPISIKKKDMSRRMYDQLRLERIAPSTQKTVISDYLYDRRRTSESSALNYKPKSNNVTKTRTGKNRHSYVAYRTVTDKSPASSWVINRGKVNKDDHSKTFVKNVDRLMKWKMKNGWS